MTVTTILRGGLANNLFGIATVLAYSMKHNCDYCIPLVIDNPHDREQKVYHSGKLNYCGETLADVMGIKANFMALGEEVYTEPSFEYKEIPKYECDKLILNGYFQSARYFDKYREEIFKKLNIPYGFEKGKVAIHVRRGDYLNLPNIHPTVTLDYIHAGIEYFIKLGYKFFTVFSDDFDYCWRNIKQYNGCQFEFNKEDTDINDLIYASSCEHFIGSNSSFSWWIYYLNRNENKIGIFPKKWFGKDMPHDTKDLVMPKMILM